MDHNIDMEKLHSLTEEIDASTLSEVLQQKIDKNEATLQNDSIDNNFGIRFFRVGELTKNIEPVEWLVEDHMEANTISLMFAPPASFKSFVAVDIAACIATGKQWHGQDVSQGAVFYIAGEGTAGLKRRFRAWEIAHGIDTSPFPLFQSGGAADLLNLSNVTLLTRTIAEASKEAGVQPKLIVIDTLARNFGGGNENDTKDMNMFIRHIDALRAAWNCTVLVVHHTGHGSTDRGRGSSALKAAVDAEYQVKRDGDSNLVTINSTKMKDAEPPAPLNLELSVVELGIRNHKGLMETSAVLIDTDKKPAPEAKPSRKLSGNHEAVLQAIRSRTATKEPTTREIIRDDLKAQGINPKNITRWLNKLLEDNLISCTENNYHLIVQP